MHVQADPVFTDFDIGPCFTQFGQHRIQRIWTGITAQHLATGNGSSNQEGTGFDTVWQHTVNPATQAFNAFDGDPVRARAADFGTQRVEEVGGIDDFRLTCRVLDDGGASCQSCSTHDGDGRAYADLIHHDMCALQTSFHRGLDVALFQFDFRTQLLQASNVQVNRTCANGTTTWQ
ncbi:hypothetical protein D3C75_937380 [compost metagenome]